MRLRPSFQPSARHGGALAARRVTTQIMQDRIFLGNNSCKNCVFSHKSDTEKNTCYRKKGRKSHQQIISIILVVKCNVKLLQAETYQKILLFLQERTKIQFIFHRDKQKCFFFSVGTYRKLAFGSIVYIYISTFGDFQNNF